MYIPPKISISPINNIEGNNCIFMPVAPGDLWLYDLYRHKITDPTGSYELAEEDDDRGLYHRCGMLVDNSDHADLTPAYVLFSCAPAQKEAPYLSNKIVIYDLYDSAVKMMPAYAVEGFVRMRHLDAVAVPRDSVRVEELVDLYESDNQILMWGGSTFKRPVLVRSVRTGEPIYKLFDPFLQWSPPRYLFMMDEVLDQPDDIENLAGLMIDSFNWDYFDQVYKSAKMGSARIDRIAATMFDVLYDDYIYPSVCRRLWVQTPAEPQSLVVMDHIKRSVIVNFTDIVNTIRIKIYSRLAEKMPALLDTDDAVKQIESIPDISELLP